eukprot:TRINITY_DN3076_c0_g1_i11.p5 TRINITY_DN3076_c0_g1~~TRINITY_DN3076_c0_g1_i11.p5  ORF type:complete len:121 (-),score=21.94 TRINITY_DN3076_c0_g1_i11:1288-1650(-)
MRQPFEKPSPQCSGCDSARGGCTNVLVVSDSALVHGHNEDWSTGVAELMSIVMTRDWTAYVYPGELAGESIAFNRWGLSVSMNSIYPDSPSGAAEVPYCMSFVLRQTIDARYFGMQLLRR